VTQDRKVAEVAAEGSDSDRRDFLVKAAAAGTLVAAGLAATMLSADAAVVRAVPTAVGQKISLKEVPLQYQKLQDGHALEIKSTELTDILAREGLIASNLKGKQSLMRLEIRYSP
jgi:hypothetical protein